MIRICAVVCFVAFAVVIVVPPARAWMKLCNKTSYTVETAVGFFGLQGWTSAGWWELPPRECHVPLTKPLEKRYYYVLAKDPQSGYVAGGKNGFCTQEIDFRIEGTHLCEKRGFAKEWMGEIDKGKHTNASVDFIEDTTVLEFGTFGYVAFDSDGKLLPESEPVGIEHRY